LYDDCGTPTGLTNNTAEDISTCGDGIDVAWTGNVVDWGDTTFRAGDIDEMATRTYDVIRNGAHRATGVAYGTTHYIDTWTSNNVPYLYQIEYNNACGLSAITTGDTATDYDYDTLVDAKLIFHTM
jgi:tetrahydromethanopterin S-methyltransferase subunit E